jgi:AraC-like DNA-binding protein
MIDKSESMADTLIHFFDDSLWRSSAFGARSPECSPLYVDRYDGPRLSPAYDAHAWWELTAVVEGSIRLGGEPPMTADKSDCVLIAPGARHYEKAERAETVWVGFQGTRMEGLERRLATITVVRSSLLTEAVEHLWLAARQQGGAIGPELDALTARLVAMFLRLASEPPLTRTTHDWVAAAVAEIGRAVGFDNAFYFSRVFRRFQNLSPLQYRKSLLTK